MGLRFFKKILSTISTPRFPFLLSILSNGQLEEILTYLFLLWDLHILQTLKFKRKNASDQKKDIFDPLVVNEAFKHIAQNTGFFCTRSSFWFLISKMASTLFNLMLVALVMQESIQLIYQQEFLPKLEIILPTKHLIPLQQSKQINKDISVCDKTFARISRANCTWKTRFTNSFLVWFVQNLIRVH